MSRQWGGVHITVPSVTTVTQKADNNDLHVEDNMKILEDTIEASSEFKPLNNSEFEHPEDTEDEILHSEDTCNENKTDFDGFIDSIESYRKLVE